MKEFNFSEDFPVRFEESLVQYENAPKGSFGFNWALQDFDRIKEDAQKVLDFEKSLTHNEILCINSIFYISNTQFSSNIVLFTPL